MRALCLALLLLTGCGLDYENGCTDTGYASVKAEAGIDCAAFRLFSTTSRQLFTDSGIATDADVSFMRSKTDVLLRASAEWKSDGQWAIGENVLFSGIQLGGMSVLWHEEMHGIEVTHFVLNSATHPTWKERGLYGLDNYYKFHMGYTGGILGTDCSKGTLTDALVQRLRLHDEWSDVGAFMQECPEQ